MTERLDALKRAVIRSHPYRRLRDLTIRAHLSNEPVIREDLARRYLFGAGIELGALTKPLRVPPGVRVQYVDRTSRAELLQEQGAELAARGLDLSAMPDTDVIDDAGTLATFADESLDFVVANHVFEHLEDPIGALENNLRVLRPGGVLLLILPDARYTFDARRKRTTVEHLLRDHAEGPEVSRRAHYEEWATIIEGHSADTARRRIEEFERDDARHHFHVWELEGFLAVLLQLSLPCELLEARVYGIEFAVVLRRTAAAPDAVVPS